MACFSEQQQKKGEEERVSKKISNMAKIDIKLSEKLLMPSKTAKRLCTHGKYSQSTSPVLCM